MIELFLKFPDRATMLAVASALSGVEDIQTPAVDGWLDGTYWNLCEVGELPGVEGYHVNGLWISDESTVPAALTPFRIYPESPAVRFG